MSLNFGLLCAREEPVLWAGCEKLGAKKIFSRVMLLGDDDAIDRLIAETEMR